MTDIGFYVQAGRETGYGHIVRSLALYDALHALDSRDMPIGCYIYSDYAGASYAFDRDYVVMLMKEQEPPKSDVWIIDLEGGAPPALTAKLRERCDVLVILNGVGYPDGDPGRLLADLVFYQGRTNRPHELDWTGFKGEWYEGPDWLILRKEFSEHRAEPGTHKPPRVVIAGGGSDPKNVTQLALDALKGTPYEIRCIIGPANNNILQVQNKNAHPMTEPDNMAEALAWADLAIVSYGMTAFECMALGLPVIALSISEDHAKSAELVHQECGGGLYHFAQVEYAQSKGLRDLVSATLNWCATYGERARAYVDGKGAARVAERIINELDK